MVTFNTLEELLAQFNANHLYYRASFLNADGPFDRADFFVGNRVETPVSLPNVRRFFDYNGWENDRLWNFDAVIMVGYNSGSNVIVDVPTTVFPWCIDYYGVSGSNALTQGLLDLHDDHVLTAACKGCYAGQRRCNLRRPGGCDRCSDVVCKPQVAKELENLRIHYIDNLLKERSTLCPSFQYLIACCGTRYGYNKAYTAFEKTTLGKIIAEEVKDREFMKEAFIREKCRAYQIVLFENGMLKNLESCEVGERLGFPQSVASKRSKDALRSIFPTFGIADSRTCFSFMNSAMNRPGEIFVADFNVWDRRLRASVVRMLILAQFKALDRMYVMVGWM